MPNLFPCGLTTRRELLWEMGGGFAGVALAGLIASESRANEDGRDKPGRSPVSSLAPKKPHFPAKAKSCIFLMMNGGPSQVDTFDPKPALEQFAGTEIPKDKKFINSGGRKIGFLTPAFRKFRPGGKSGLPVSDYFPRVREHADKLAVIRSCHTDSHAHGSALVMMNTGKTFIGRPSLGSWAVYGLGTVNQDLPGYVVLMDKRGGPISGQPNWSSGFMSAAYLGTLFRPTGDPLLDLRCPAHPTQDAQREQLDLLAKLNQEHLDAHPGGRELAARAASYELAFRMQAATPEAVDLTKESAKTLELYGVGKQPTAEFGTNCLIARRLVERGVRFVQLYSGGGHLEDTWDAHAGIESNHGKHAAEVDRPIAALLTDLQARGLRQHARGVGGEFGRMPFSEGKNEPGRNHNPYGFSMWLRAGVKGGIAYGATDELGFEAVENRSTSTTCTRPSCTSRASTTEKLTYFHRAATNA